LFLDIGGVLLTNGLGRHARKRATAKFKLEWGEMEDRHRLNFSTCEEGKLTLEEYLSRTVFYDEQPFKRDQFLKFMLANLFGGRLPSRYQIQFNNRCHFCSK
jgi:putative hydrolase of the HAD superfamily